MSKKKLKTLTGKEESLDGRDDKVGQLHYYYYYFNSKPHIQEKSMNCLAVLWQKAESNLEAGL